MLKKVSYKDLFRFAWSYWKRRKKLAFWTLFFISIATAVDIVFPLYVGKLVDYFAQPYEEGHAAAFTTLLTVLGLSILFFLSRWLQFRAYNVYECHSMRDILIEALHKVQRFSTNWHSNNFAGGTVRKITRARTAFEMFEDTLILHLLPAVIILFGISASLYLKMPLVGMFVFFNALLYCALSIFISVKLLAPTYQISAASDTRVGAVLADIISGSPTVKAFGAEEREDQYFYQTAEDWRHKTQYSYRKTNDMDVVRSILSFTMLAGMLSLTYHLWKAGEATPGDITMVITSYFMMNGYLREIGRFISNLQRSISDMEDAIYFWKTDIAVRDKAKAKALEPTVGRIEFDGITFAYNDNTVPIYDNFSIDIAPGERVALVGHSGSGKSTFVKLLQRLYDIKSGKIRIDGQDIAEVTQSSLRQKIALVPQDPILFHRTLYENIAYGLPEATEEQIIKSAQKAYAHDFIISLPNGYETMVGERGIKLSGGERQRVAIARAILADAPILILDEATSSLDSISEDYIQLALEELMKGRTAITIAHRLSTIKNVDRILVFDQGRIIEQGTHKELLKSDTHYKKLFDVQILGLMD